MIDVGALSQGLVRRDDGIWYAARDVAVSYPTEGHNTCFAVEDNSFWFKHRNACILAAVQRHCPSGAVFDVGAGNGYVAAALTAAGFEVVVVEPGVQGAHHARRRGLTNVVCATTTTACFVPESMPAVGLFDVIEHVDDDLRFMRSIFGLLKPGGWLYATVPAYPWLWSDEDVRAGHFRRHTRDSITEVAQQAGFDVEYASYFFQPLPVPILLLRALPHWLGLSRDSEMIEGAQRDHGGGGAQIKRLLERLLAYEVTHVAAGRRMRFGGSCLLVARKP